MDALLRHVSRLKHDLGKYVALQTRWLPDDASDETRLQALRADLLETRRGPSGTAPAPEVWAELRRALVGDVPLDDGSTADLASDPDVVAIDRAMARIAKDCDRLRGDPSHDVLRELERCARDIAASCQSLHRRVSTRPPG